MLLGVWTSNMSNELCSAMQWLTQVVCGVFAGACGTTFSVFDSIYQILRPIKHRMPVGWLVNAERYPQNAKLLHLKWCLQHPTQRRRYKRHRFIVLTLAFRTHVLALSECVLASFASSSSSSFFLRRGFNELMRFSLLSSEILSYRRLPRSN